MHIHSPHAVVTKTLTGIRGFDEITDGGLPRGRTTLVMGGLCDLMMPDMTGMDFHGELLRVRPELTNRVIFMTGGAFTAKAQQFLLQTPTEHIEKPFHPANLRAIIQRHLR